MKHYPDQDVADNRRSVRRRARQLEQPQRRALRTQVITAVLALLGIVGAYWLGTSFSSQRKTELSAGGAKLPGV